MDQDNILRYQLIRSRRKTISIQIKGGKVIVRAPLQTKNAEIEAFIHQKMNWIEKHLKEQQKRAEEKKALPPFTEEEIRAMAEKALQIIPLRVAWYARQIGVDYGRITIRNQKTRWGSCSAKGNLNFNCLLVLTPQEVMDSVVVHELCHRKEMNHSTDFYKEVYRVFPDYDRCRKWLNEHQDSLIGRLP